MTIATTTTTDIPCPKCGAPAPLVREHRPDTQTYPYTGPNGVTVFPSLEDIIASIPAPPIFEQRFDKLYACATHGEFGLKPDGSPEFADPDTYVEGPNGEKLFRM